MAKLSKYRFNLGKIRTFLAMVGIMVFIVFSLFSVLSKPRTASKLSTIFMIRWFQSTVFKKV